GANIQKVNLSVDEWRVVSYINPKNTMQQIAKATNLKESEFRRIVFSLLQAGIVEIVRPEGVPRFAREPGRISVSSNASKKEQKSLMNRIIARIRSL
ncbi:MAG: Rrf2 family transcriptional regulator, partial [Anaerolineaceae bacterium]|nr:Rrf2 family transcriptional regulator [Anaerolineaceae bacterium]